MKTNIELRPAIGEVWQHFKGPKYRIVGLCEDVGEGEEMSVRVLYSSLDEPARIWGRPLDQFMGLHRSGFKRFIKWTPKTEYRVVPDDEGQYASEAAESHELALKYSFETCSDYNEEFTGEKLKGEDWTEEHDGFEFEIWTTVEVMPSQFSDCQDLIEGLEESTEVDWNGSQPFEVKKEVMENFEAELNSVLDRYAGNSGYWIYKDSKRYRIKGGKPVSLDRGEE